MVDSGLQVTAAPREDSTDQAECHGISNIDNDHDESIISGALLPANHPELYSPRLDVSTTSLANIALASFWLQYCLRNHQPCAQFDKRGPLPSRVIDVSQPQQPVLVEGMNRVENYITLSYKWGESAKYFTLAQNLCEHEETGIPLIFLPRTFKDAMHVTHSLGFRWL
ncbi:uncharacterized protein F4817DRAFT_319559 [Daldinia loculata]|uniref:uncharacterized protein n=1 Tax=Daldinia loculata TaxID=103429 RepID=UPI0020C29F29|nr:uncharacterized protein F4817DRAFT_319559 [Daldinia loculata]KAI1643678.1 hypothetical protein F4817DRAFT_319559 [Daldinia loculata]